MITGIWMDEDDGAMRLVVEFDDGDGGLVEVNLATDPPTTADLDTFDATGWVEMGPKP